MVEQRYWPLLFLILLVYFRDCAMPFLPFFLVCFIFFVASETASAKPQKKGKQKGGSKKIVIELDS